MLQPFGDGIWLADGSTTSTAGFRYPTRTAIIRLSAGGLFVWSPVALTNSLRTAVEALGDVQFVVAPNDLHHLWLADWKTAFPSAQLYAPPGLRKRRHDLVFDGELADGLDPAWGADLDQVIVRGNLITTEVVFFHHASRTAIFTDLIQHFEPDWFSGWRAVVARLDLMAATEPEVPRKFRTAFVDRRSARAALARILEWPIDNVLMAHAPPVSGGGSAFVRRAFRWLLPPPPAAL
jgi:hypothetical protein